MRTMTWIAGSLLFAPAVAAAEPQVAPGGEPRPPTLGWIGAESTGGPRTLMQVIPSLPAPDGIVEHAGPTIIYLNKNGVTLTPGNNDSRTNRSSIIDQTTQISAFEGSAAEWNSVIGCVRQLFAPFDVQITDVDPGNVPHYESVMGGRAEQAGMPQGVLGVSPFTVDCSVIPNAIVFTFTQSTRDYYGTSSGLPETICEIAAQEIAHAFGLDHEYLASDPMTYLDYNGLKTFQNTAAQCGEYQARTCGLPGTGVVCRQTQNSVSMLEQRIGVGDAIAPTVAITSPQNNATVPPSFTVATTASDNNAVVKVELYVDGTLVETRTTAPFSFSLSDLSVGGHAVMARAWDTKNVAESSIQITVQNGAPPPDPTPDPDDPDGDGTDDVIVGGCAAGGGGASGMFALALVAAVVLRPRRRRR